MGGILFAYLSLVVTAWFLIPLFLLFVGVALYKRTLRCPGCGALAGQKRPYTLSGFYFNHKVPDQCEVCGYLLVEHDND